MNGNGINGGSPQAMQLNPVEAARIGLMFLQRVQMNASERNAFGMIEALLDAITRGAVIVTAPPMPEQRTDLVNQQPPALPEPSP